MTQGSQSEPSRGTRSEADLVGKRDLPADARYGIHTLRALENFPAVGLTVADVSEFARAFGMVKLAAAQADLASGLLEGEVGEAVEQACRELAEGSPELRAQLVLPVLQGGAGTSTNMNVNEVLANRALQLLDLPAGSYDVCHPNDHVNRSQSTNDVYPTALRLALIFRDAELVRPAVESLVISLKRSAERFVGVTKLGRTQLQDAVPMTVDQEFDAWADAIGVALRGLSRATAALAEVNLGGTAIGTGLAASDSYRRRVIVNLAEISGLEVRAANGLVAATTDPNALLAVSSALRACSIALAKVANDLRLLSSGPLTGLAEYRLPARQAGSSIMPGKVNPVIPEFANLAAFRIRGLDMVVALALDAGQLQLNAMLPGVAEALFESQSLLAAASRTLAEHCVDGIDVDEQRMGLFAAEGLGELTELAATAGYSTALAVAGALKGADAERR
jgi:aspartate ammonia-lyase